MKKPDTTPTLENTLIRIGASRRLEELDNERELLVAILDNVTETTPTDDEKRRHATSLRMKRYWKQRRAAQKATK